MTEQGFDSMNGMEFDFLKEIGNIGAGNATTALATMLKLKVEMQVPKVALLDFQELPEILGGAENPIAGILLTLRGEIEGMMMFVLEYSAARSRVNLLMGHEKRVEEPLDEIDA